MARLLQAEVRKLGTALAVLGSRKTPMCVPGHTLPDFGTPVLSGHDSGFFDGSDLSGGLFVAGPAGNAGDVGWIGWIGCRPGVSAAAVGR